MLDDATNSRVANFISTHELEIPGGKRYIVWLFDPTWDEWRPVARLDWEAAFSRAAELHRDLMVPASTIAVTSERATPVALPWEAFVESPVARARTQIDELHGWLLGLVNEGGSA